MTDTGQLVDQIVAKVMARLADSSPAAAARPESNVEEPSVAVPVIGTGASTGRAQRLTERVITAGVLEAHWQGVSTIEVAKTAVLTPSAWDFLRAHSIRCVQRECGESSIAEQARWLVIHIDVTAATRRFVGELRRRAERMTSFELTSSAGEAASMGISALCRSEVRGVVAVVQETELTACLANRNDQVRAAAVMAPERIDVLKHSWDPNFWILDPTGKSYFELLSVWNKLTS